MWNDKHRVKRKGWSRSDIPDGIAMPSHVLYHHVTSFCMPGADDVNIDAAQAWSLPSLHTGLPGLMCQVQSRCIRPLSLTLGRIVWPMFESKEEQAIPENSQSSCQLSRTVPAAGFRTPINDARVEVITLWTPSTNTWCASQVVWFYATCNISK